jgi:hypothetical protein
MKTQGNFKYFLDGKQLKDFDEFENKTKNVDVSINVIGLEIYAKVVDKR